MSIRRKCSSGYPSVLTGRNPMRVLDFFLIESIGLPSAWSYAVEELSFHTLVMP
jgi:hypothetical protein